MELNRGDYKNLKKVEDPNAECFKCGAKEEIYEDPNIEGMYFYDTPLTKERGFSG
jgi:hypothetical protein